MADLALIINLGSSSLKAALVESTRAALSLELPKLMTRQRPVIRVRRR